MVSEKDDWSSLPFPGNYFILVALPKIAAGINLRWFTGMRQKIPLLLIAGIPRVLMPPSFSVAEVGMIKSKTLSKSKLNNAIN